LKIKRIPLAVGLYTLTGVLTTGVIIAFGILSASGMLLVSPSLALAIGAFVFGGVVEGEVFKEEIFEGLHDFALLGKRGYHKLITNMLDQLSEEVQFGGFLGEYQRLKKFLGNLRGNKLTDAQKAEKHAAQKRLRHMQAFLAKRVLAKGDLSLAPFGEDQELAQMIVAIKQRLPGMKAKMILFRLALPFSLLCGAGFGMATAAALPAALAMISVSLSFMLWPLVAVAAVGYTLLVFHTVKDILFSDSMRHWLQRLKKWFTPENGRITPGFIFKTVALSLVVAATAALCVMGTLATAGTWWIAVKHGAKLLPYMQQAANWIRNILTPLAVAGNFIFSVFNSFESISTIVHAIQESHPFRQLKADWQQLRERENLAQIVNPFRFVCKVLQKSLDTILLLGHTAASGVARDQFLNIPPALLAGTSAANELAQDIPFFFEEGKKSLAQRAVTVLLSPLLLLSAGWQFIASRSNELDKRVSFKRALQDAFDAKVKPVYAGDVAPQQSPAWREVEIHRAFKKQEKRLSSVVCAEDLAQEKIAALNRIKADLLQAGQDRAVVVSDGDKKILRQLRWFSSREQPARSAVFAEHMTHKFGLNNA
jgi:hypothetical protein